MTKVSCDFCGVNIAINAQSQLHVTFSVAPPYAEVRNYDLCSECYQRARGSFLKVKEETVWIG